MQMAQKENVRATWIITHHSVACFCGWFLIIYDSVLAEKKEVNKQKDITELKKNLSSECLSVSYSSLHKVLVQEVDNAGWPVDNISLCVYWNKSDSVNVLLPRPLRLACDDLDVKF